MKVTGFLLIKFNTLARNLPMASGSTSPKDLPHWVHRHPKCQTHTSSNSAVDSLCTVLSGGLVNGVLSEKQIRGCGKGETTNVNYIAPLSVTQKGEKTLNIKAPMNSIPHMKAIGRHLRRYQLLHVKSDAKLGNMNKDNLITKL